MNDKQLISRWTNEWENEYKKVIHALKHRKGIEGLNLPKTENGRTDLRGIVFPKPEGIEEILGCEILSKPFLIKKCHFDNIDFSLADISYTWFEKCLFVNCVFEKTNMKSVRLEAIHFIDCLLVKTDLRDSFIGGRVGKNSGEIQRTVFRKCNFAKTNVSSPVINETAFEDCIINDTDFDSSRFANCTFKGKIKQSFFRGYSKHWEPGFKLFRRVNYKKFPNLMMNVDFTECEFDDVNFSHGIDLSHCRFPASENLVVVRDLKKVYEKAKQIIGETWSDPERDLYLRMIDEVHYRKDVREQNMNVLEYWAEDPRKFFELIKQVNSEL